MRKQVLVIGLGQFGMALVESLAHRGVEVLAVDRNARLVDEAAGVVAQAVAFDATDEDALARADPARRDMAVCAIGPATREASILVTALLKQMGCPCIISRAADDLHARILRLVGASDVVNPERDFGERLAARLALSGLVDEVPLGPDLLLSEVRIPPAFVGRTLVDLALPRRYGVTLIAIRHASDDGRGSLRLPVPQEPLEAGDILVLAGSRGAVSTMLGKL